MYNKARLFSIKTLSKLAHITSSNYNAHKQFAEVFIYFTCTMRRMYVLILFLFKSVLPTFVRYTIYDIVFVLNKDIKEWCA